MSVEALIAQIEAQRLKPCDLYDGASAKFEVPSAFGAFAIYKAIQGGASTGDELIRLCGLHLREWSGITSATMLGAAVGSTDPAPYDPRLWRVLAGRRPEIVSDVANAMLSAAMAEREAEDATAGN